MEENKITIIEGPPPTFSGINEGWVVGVNDSHVLGEVAITQLRTFNGPALVERCHKAWRNHGVIHLEYKQSDGLILHAPIVAARNVETPEGHLLILWVRLPQPDAELEVGYENGDDNDDDDILRPSWPE